jgi:hypothetical protein
MNWNQVSTLTVLAIFGFAGINSWGESAIPQTPLGSIPDSSKFHCARVGSAPTGYANPFVGFDARTASLFMRTDQELWVLQKAVGAEDQYSLSNGSPKVSFTFTAAQSTPSAVLLRGAAGVGVIIAKKSAILRQSAEDGSASFFACLSYDNYSGWGGEHIQMSDLLAFSHGIENLDTAAQQGRAFFYSEDDKPLFPVLTQALKDYGLYNKSGQFVAGNPVLLAADTATVLLLISKVFQLAFAAITRGATMALVIFPEPGSRVIRLDTDQLGLDVKAIGDFLQADGSEQREKCAQDSYKKLCSALGQAEFDFMTREGLTL